MLQTKLFKMIQSGWLYDIYQLNNKIIIWLIDENGQHFRYVDYLHPTFYFSGSKEILTKALNLIKISKIKVSLESEKKHDLKKGKINVVQVRCLKASDKNILTLELQKLSPMIDLYNVDLNLVQEYLFSKNIFPHAYCQIETQNQFIKNISSLDSRWQFAYQSPPLKIMEMCLDGEKINPNQGFRGNLLLRFEKQNHLLVDEHPSDLIDRINEILSDYDPDIIFTDWGDSFLIPEILKLAKKYNKEVFFNRDPEVKKIYTSEQRSYFTYGKIVYKPAAQIFFGRLHIDKRNSFMLQEGDLDGIFELTRITNQPIQKAARSSIGTGLSSMQLETAYNQGILIPWHKQVPEDFKSADQLFLSDKGGLVYQPISGFHEQAAQLDFSSMYPTIMINHNISPETINCSCCSNTKVVPEIGYSICQKKEGLIPKTLRPLVERRLTFKEMVKKCTDSQEINKMEKYISVHKWLLVTCFGYLGYKNARFGQIEAHESVTAFGREILLRAKELAENLGFQFYHAIVDCIFIKKSGALEKDYLQLADLITKETGIKMGIDGIYDWLIFLNSRTNPMQTVANRYFGVFSNGSLKVRGLAIRRHDSPKIVKSLQEELLNLFSQTHNKEQFKEKIAEALEILNLFIEKVRSGSVSFSELAIKIYLSRSPDQYKGNSAQAIAAWHLKKRGINLKPGQSIEYIIVDADNKDPQARYLPLVLANFISDFDREKYVELLIRATSELISNFGYTEDRLKELVNEPASLP